jgi:hypothetical protein
MATNIACLDDHVSALASDGKGYRNNVFDNKCKKDMAVRKQKEMGAANSRGSG